MSPICRAGLLFGILVSGAAFADDWGGSVAVTSDYVVRGLTRSADQAATQLDLHYLGSSGGFAGVFASTARIDPDEAGSAELNGFVGFAFAGAEDWRGKVLAGVYAYPGSAHGSQYDYGELGLDLGYREWLSVKLLYSPDTPRYLPGRGFARVAAESAELAVQHPIRGRLYGMLGAGYSVLGGEGQAGYAYWSAGVLFDLAPVALLASYVAASPEAKSLFYGTDAHDHWLATLIWRF